MFQPGIPSYYHRTEALKVGALIIRIIRNPQNSIIYAPILSRGCGKEGPNPARGEGDGHGKESEGQAPAWMRAQPNSAVMNRIGFRASGLRFRVLPVMVVTRATAAFCCHYYRNFSERHHHYHHHDNNDY